MKHGSIVKPWARGIETDGARFFVVRVSSLGRRDENEHDAKGAALDDLFQPYAWPGGYPVAWLDNEGALCPACARKEYETDKDARGKMARGAMSCDVYEGCSHDHGVIICDNCGAAIVPECDETH